MSCLRSLSIEVRPARDVSCSYSRRMHPGFGPLTAVIGQLRSEIHLLKCSRDCKALTPFSLHLCHELCDDIAPFCVFMRLIISKGCCFVSPFGFCARSFSSAPEQLYFLYF